MSEAPIFRGYAIFCDDIRNEVGGKTSFIGVYDTVMLVHGDFPFVIPKFGIAVRYLEKRDACTGDVTLRVFLPGEANPIIEGTFPMHEARRSVPLAPPTPDRGAEETHYIQVGTNIVLASLVLQNEGLIKVRIQCGEEIVKIGTLQILKAATTEA